MPTPSNPYRPMPPDFPALFAQHGWDGIEDAVRAHKDTIRAWAIEYGYDRLKMMRREHLEAIYAKRGHRIPGRRPTSTSGRYVMGLRRKIVWKTRAPRFWDVELLVAERVERPSVRAALMAGSAPVLPQPSLLLGDEMDAVIAKARSMGASDDAIAAWLDANLADFGSTPRQMVEDGLVGEVLEHLARIDAGGFA